MELRVATYQSETARELADLAAILQDLNHVVRVCKLLAQLPEPRNGDMVRALWAAAVVAYSRCFDTGKRERLATESLAVLEGEPLKVHQFVKQMRDKHIAHSVNAFESVHVGLVLTEDGHIHGISMQGRMHLSAGNEGVANLAILASTAAAEVARRGKALQEQVKAEAAALATDELGRLPTWSTTVPGPDDAGMARF